MRSRTQECVATKELSMRKLFAVLGITTAFCVNMAVMLLPAYAEEPGRSEGYRKVYWGPRSTSHFPFR